MKQKLYVGNLNFETTEDEVRDLFKTYGEVQEVKIVVDRYTGRSRGFAFVHMVSADAAAKAAEGLNGHPFKGRNLAIDFAKDEQRREDRGGGGGERRERDRGHAREYR